MISNLSLDVEWDRICSEIESALKVIKNEIY